MATDEGVRSLVQVRWHRRVERCVASSATGWRVALEELAKTTGDG